MKNWRIIITCEHASNEVPPQFTSIFSGKNCVLESHRGWDPGALPVAQYLEKKLNVPFFQNPVTRLLVESNRSIDSQSLFSEITWPLDEDDRNSIIEEYYYKYRNSVEDSIKEEMNQGRVLHLSIHTFTPVFDGSERMLDIGLLFDDARVLEKAFCESLKLCLEQNLHDKTIVFNEPYNGADDGFTTYLRNKYEKENYLGIEIEINQKWAFQPESASIQSALYTALKDLRS